MSEFKNKIEDLFERSGHVLYQNRIKVLLIIFLFFGILSFQITKLTVDTSAEGFLHKDDQIRIAHNAFMDQFGRDETVIIMIKPHDIFNSNFLKKLKSFHNELESKVPYVREVRSLINARNTRGKDDVLFVDELLKDWPEKNIDLNQLKDQALKNPVYINNIISEDGRYTALLIETEAIIKTNSAEDLLTEFEDDTEINEQELNKSRYFSEKENREVVEAVSTIADQYRGSDFEIALSGGPVIIDVFNRASMDDAILCMMLVPIPMVFFLIILFRRISGVILPNLVIMPPMLSTIGLMAICNRPFTILTSALPAFLIAVGVGDSVHILAIFYRRLAQGSSKEDAISYALGHSGLAVLMTTLTTAAGLLSFSFAELSAIADLGIFAAVGVVMALICTVVMLPAIIALVPIKKEFTDKKQTVLMDRLLLSFADFSTSHPVIIIAASIIIFTASIAVMFRLDFAHDPISWCPDTMVIKKDVALIDEKLKGVVPLEVVVDTKKVNGIYEPEILNSIEILSKEIGKISSFDLFVGKVFTINDILKEINQALHENDPAYYTIPQDRKTIAQEFLLFENSGSDDLERIVDSQFSKTRITIKTSWADAVVFEDFIKDVKKRFNEIFLDKTDITITGEMALTARTIPAALYSMAQSYAIAFIVITIMMILLVGDLKIGMISMIPNLLPIFLTMGIIGGSGIPLDMNTLMIGSVAIGLVVDDTVHFIHNFQRYYEKTGNPLKAVRETFLGTGRALLITTLVLCSAFFTDMFGSLQHVVRFGFFCGLTIIFALLADFILAPALLVMATQKRTT